MLSPKTAKPKAKATKAKATKAKGTKMTQSTFPFPAVDKTTPSPKVSAPNHPVPEQVDPLLVEILAWPREYKSVTEIEFQSWLVDKINALGFKPTLKSEGAIAVEVRDAKGNPPTTLFSCHTDTVDRGPVAANSRKSLDYDANFGLIMLAKDNTVGSCLGADDGAGVWLMLKMIEAKVPGGYIFNRAEECGGIGAKALASKDKDYLAQFQIAVAFDRPRDNEIITHQRGRRTCSDKFANALARALCAVNSEFDYAASSRGVYTDTADYASIVSECTNVGVGYTDQHGKDETQDYAHLHALMLACIKLNWDALPADRDPKMNDWLAYTPPKPKAPAKWSAMSDIDEYGWNMPAPKPKSAPAPTLHIEDEILEGGSLAEWADYASDDPEAVAELLITAAAEIKALRAKCDALFGVIKSSR